MGDIMKNVVDYLELMKEAEEKVRLRMGSCGLHFKSNRNFEILS